VRSRGDSYPRQTVGGRCGVEHDISDGLAGRLPATRPRALAASTGGNIPSPCCRRGGYAIAMSLTLAPPLVASEPTYTGYSNP
jgi:hypothetical protein